MPPQETPETPSDDFALVDALRAVIDRFIIKSEKREKEEEAYAAQLQAAFTGLRTERERLQQENLKLQGTLEGLTQAVVDGDEAKRLLLAKIDELEEALEVKAASYKKEVDKLKEALEVQAASYKSSDVSRAEYTKMFTDEEKKGQELMEMVEASQARSVHRSLDVLLTILTDSSRVRPSMSDFKTNIRMRWAF
jgi:chromosome segregation ATPase